MEYKGGVKPFTYLEVSTRPVIVRGLFPALVCFTLGNPKSNPCGSLENPLQVQRVLNHFPFYLFKELIEAISQHHIDKLPPPPQELLDEIGKGCSIQNVGGPVSCGH